MELDWYEDQETVFKWIRFCDYLTISCLIFIFNYVLLLCGISIQMKDVLNKRLFKVKSVWIFLITNFILILHSVSFVEMLLYMVISMSMPFVTKLLGIVALSYQGRMNRVTWRWRSNPFSHWRADTFVWLYIYIIDPFHYKLLPRFSLYLTIQFLPRNIYNTDIYSHEKIETMNPLWFKVELHILVLMMELAVQFIYSLSLPTVREEINAASFQMQAPNWSQLPDYALSTVVNQLTTIKDLTACSLVCRAWNLFCSNMNWTPWLMLSENPNSNRRRFFCLYNNKCYELELPMVRGRRCYGTAQGWIIAVGPDLQPYLFHPRRQVKIDLPALNALTDGFNFIQKLIAFETSPDQFLVMAIYGPSSSLAYAKPGDSNWVIVRDANHSKGANHFKDVTFHRDHYYALRERGMLMRCELSGPKSRALFVAFPPTTVQRADKIYLVESSGELFGVFGYGSANVSEQRYKKKRFEVYKYLFDVPSHVYPEWERVKDLKDCAFFVGASNSWSICASNIVYCKRNCIYFTDDNWKTNGGHDNGVFDMASEKTEWFNFGVDSPSYYSRPIWLNSTLR